MTQLKKCRNRTYTLVYKLNTRRNCPCSLCMKIWAKSMWSICWSMIYTYVYLGTNPRGIFVVQISSCLWRIQKKKNALSCIHKNLDAHFLIWFLFDSLCMALESWKNIIYEGGTVVHLQGASIRKILKRKFDRWSFDRDWLHIKKKKFKWYTSVYHVDSRRKCPFWSLTNLLTYPMIIWVVPTFQEYKLQIIWRDLV